MELRFDGSSMNLGNVVLDEDGLILVTPGTATDSVRLVVHGKDSEAGNWYYTKEIDEETLMMQALDAGASDFAAEENYFEISTEPDDFTAVCDALEAEGYKFASAQVENVPQTTVTLTSEDDIKNMNKLVDALEEDDDVQDIYHNWEENE